MRMKLKRESLEECILATHEDEFYRKVFFYIISYFIVLKLMIYVFSYSATSLHLDNGS